LCIRPTTPADHAEQHKNKSSRIRMRDKQSSPRARLGERVTWRNRSSQRKFAAVFQ
jgi:hypothetical protein